VQRGQKAITLDLEKEIDDERDWRKVASVEVSHKSQRQTDGDRDTPTGRGPLETSWERQGLISKYTIPLPRGELEKLSQSVFLAAQQDCFTEKAKNW